MKTISYFELIHISASEDMPSGLKGLADTASQEFTIICSPTENQRSARRHASAWWLARDWPLLVTSSDTKWKWLDVFASRAVLALRTRS